ncbi:amino acid adenylation domain-containing protein, partial [Corallococcus praedator]
MASHAPAYATLLDLIDERARQGAERRLYTFLEEGEETALTFAGLRERARAIAATLQAHGGAGERVVLLYPPGLDYVAGFFGCLTAGAVAVPAYPPDPSRLERTLPRLRAIIQDARATVVLTTSFVLSMAEFLFEQAPELRGVKWLATDDLPTDAAGSWKAPDLKSDSLAFLQYTSGSTGTPKGVMLTHGNLVHNLGLIHHAFETRNDSVAVIWLPPYHDMGLIGGIMQPLFGGYPAVLMSPLSFLKRPMAWMEAVSRYGGTVSGGPNFAFDLCVRKSTPEQRQALDLSRWEVAFTGAEPIRPETLDRFVEAFGPSGFKREAFYPCYGLAEGTLIVSGGQKSAPPLSMTLSASALEQHRAEETGVNDAGARTLVGCGQTILDQRIAIVDPETRERRAPGVVGEIWVSGRSVATGYWGREDSSHDTFQARIAQEDSLPYLRTGDLGFLRPDGELYVTGRRKDLIILRGRNHYPQDMEATVEVGHPALRPGGGAVFSVDVGGEERAVVVQEIDVRKLGGLRQQFEAADAAIGVIRQRLAELHEVQAYAVVLIEPGSLPKTSSGKVQRHACRAGFLTGTLQEVMAWREPPPEPPSGSDPGSGPGPGSTGPTSSGGASRASTAPAAAPVTKAGAETAEALEAWLRDVVARHLRVRREELDLQAPVTRYGLDSLAAVELAHEVSTGTGLTVPMELLLQGPSIASLARQLVALREAQGPGRTAPRQLDVTGDREVSFSQARLWFLDQYAPGDVAYNLPAAVRLDGALDVVALEESLAALAERHDALRTTFRAQDGRPLQVIAPHAALPLERVSFESLSASEGESAAALRAQEEARRPFDLARGPLVRATLLTLAPSTHVLVLVMHHAVSDGASMAVLVRELSALYAARREGRPSPLPALPLRYADFADWQREGLDGPVLEARLKYWKQQLSGAPRLLELPTDRPRAVVRDVRGERLPVVLDRALTDAVKTLAVREGVTPFMVLLAGFQAVLARHAGQDDVSVGTAIAGRERAEFQGLVGFFVNTLVMRTRLSGAPTFQQLLGRVRDTALGAYAHQDVPFEKLVEALQPARERGHTPLFQVMFILQGAQVGAPVLPGLQSRLLDVHTGTAMFDLTLSLAESTRGLEGFLEYATDLFDADTVARLSGHLRVLLQAAVAEPSRRVDALPLLDAAEAKHLSALAQGPVTDFPSEATIASLFAAQVLRTPDAVALIVGDTRLTYRELRQRARAVARELRARGVGPESVVGLCVDRSVELAVGLLGILEAGAAYLPLDPGYPAERLASMWQDSGARVLVGPRHLDGVLRVPEGQRLVLEASLDASVSPAGDFPDAAPRETDSGTLAYVLYTSGSTGRPKGVLVPHRTVMNFFRAMDAHVSPRSGTWLAVTSISFDISVLELLWTWTRGFQVVLAPVGLEPVALAQTLERHAATHLQCTPSYARALVEEPRALEALGGLGQMLVGGEALPGALAARLRARVPVLLNMYGPTETTVWSSTHRVEAERSGTVSLGRPLANTGLHLLDAHLRPVPMGVPGELFIGGDGVVRGYLGRPDLTAERFVPDAFGGTPGARLYRTGDRARWRTDGTLEFLGRVDHQVKVRGFRIEPGEVESVLGQHAGVAASVVVAREDVPGDARLVAYVVAKPGQTLGESALREHARRLLPESMVPSSVMVLDALPLTPNGKVDRAALPVPEAPRAEHGFVAPGTPTEVLLAGLWSQLLRVESVGLRDDFFALGGHSLLATRLSSSVRAAFQVELPVRELFDASTLGALAARIDALRLGQAGVLGPALHAVPRDGALVPSFAQQRLWFLEQLEPGNPAYHIPVAVELDGALDVHALERAFEALVQRHESLRTTLVAPEGQPFQVVAAPSPVPLVGKDLSAHEDAGAEVRRLMAEEARRPFDLARGPLLRLTLLKCAPTRHVLLLTMHHVVSDGGSMLVMVREVAALYEAFVSGHASPLPPLSLQPADHAAWQRTWLQGETLEAQLAWWRAKLEGASHVLALPTDRPRPVVQTAAGATLPVHLSPGLTDAVRALARREGVTPFMVLLAAWQVLMARHAGQDDVLVGSPVAGRDRAELEGLIGLFVNTLVLRARLGENPSFRELLQQVRETTLGAYAHQAVPFEKLVDALQPQRDLSRSPLFQVMLALQEDPLPELRLPGLSLRMLEEEGAGAQFDLKLSLTDAASGFTGTLEYNTDLFDATTVARWVEHLDVLLTAAVAHPETRVKSLPLMSVAERHLLLVDWNATHRDYPTDVTLHGLVEAQVARTPDAVAVDFEGLRLTYRELDARANQLAHHLRERGVGPEVRVGVCVERSLELVVALLGVLKAGGAYVPIDPSAPAERLTYQVADSAVAVLLTQRHLVDLLSVGNTPVVCLDSDWAQVERSSAAPVESGAGPEHLAYVIYTSGSTGRPKGAMNTHAGICNRLLWMQEAYGLEPQDVVLQKTPFSFDVSVWEFFWPLITGARLLVARPGGHQDAAYLVDVMAREGVTTLHFVPSMLQVFLEESGLERCTALRRVVCSGEALPLELKDRCLERLGVPLHNLYGPTEAAVDVTFWACERDDGRRSVPIGRPVANTQILILDEALEPVPVGLAGELYIGGVQVGRGYLGRPSLTAERFVPNPHGPAGTRLYRTGDQARILADGSIEYLGRLDFQVKVRGFRIELGEVEAALGQCEGVRESVVVVREDAPGIKRLVAYVVGQADARVSVDGLRAELKARLPEYMVPAAFVVLEALPLSSNGKVDRKALPAPEASTEASESYEAPRTRTEETLAGVWARVLGVERVGVRENFFALGGDSILSIQVVAKAGQAGLKVTPKQLFQHPTVEQLAKVVEAVRGSVGEQGLVEGEAALTPIQRWFFEKELPQAHHFNQAVLLEAKEGVEAERLEEALRALVEHHDALRMRYLRGDSGWTQHNAGLEKALVLEQVDVSALSEADQARALADAVARTQASLDLSEGLLLRALLIERGAGRTSRLLLVVHHLVVDGVSWRVLLEDLGTAYVQRREGRAVELPAKTTSFQAWARKLETYARGPELEKEAAWWLSQPQDACALPVDTVGDNTVASARGVLAKLDAEATRVLLQEVPAAYRATVNEVLVAALARVLTKWSGQSQVRVDVEGHGREELFADADVTRTVGWFTSLYPVVLEVPEAGTPGDALRAVRDTLRQVPGKGVGYGLLRYQGPESVVAKLKQTPKAQVAFNYLGQFDALATGAGGFTLAKESSGPVMGEGGQRGHVLEVNGLVVGGQLEVTWTYSEGLHTRATVEALARAYTEALRTLVTGRQTEDAARYTPADFPLAKLDARTLSQVQAKVDGFEDIYPLSPMQQGILFHTLLAPTSGVYFEQLSWSFHAPLDTQALRRTWEELLARHAVLRTTFLWEGIEEPLQVVRKQVALPWRELDWRGQTEEAQRQQLETFLAEDRTRGFDLAEGPLLRIALVRLDTNVHRFIWSFHHTMLDGWSMALLLKQVFALYQARVQGRVLPKGPAGANYRDYIAWLRQQDTGRSEDFWRAEFAGIQAPTSLPGDTHAAVSVPQGHAERSIHLSSRSTAALQAFTRRQQLTLNTLVQAGWALVLARHSGEPDVVFGATVSGRPPELPGAEDAPGLFINTLPVRMHVAADATVVSWLRQLQARQTESQAHEHDSLVRVQGWSEVPHGTPLFQSLFAFENYPLDASLMAQGNPLGIRDVRGIERSNYPLTALALPGRELLLKLSYDTPRYSAQGVDRLLEQWKQAVEGLVAGEEGRVWEVGILSAEERQRVLVEWNQTQATFPRDATLPRLFEAQVARTPGATAVISGTRHLTYREVEARSNQLAHRLRKLGVGPESPVGLCVERTEDLIIGTLGILKAGGAYVPLDPSYPKQRLAFLLEDARGPALVAHSHLLEALPAFSGQAVCLDREADWEDESTCPVHVDIEPENVAYLIYTSGSTGRPKGVAITHRGAVAFLTWALETFEEEETRAVLASTSLNFDLSVFELFTPLARGGTVVVVRNALQLAEEKLEAAVTLINTVPSAMAQLVRLNALPPSVRVVNLAGEALPESLSKQVYGIPTVHKLYNLYGPSEDTTYSTWSRVGRDEVPNIGRPVANTRAYVLDASFQPVPVGVAGELYLAGDGQARGYQLRPDLTAEKFLPEVHGPAGSRMYRTGDLARWREDGVLEYLGRADTQVKVRGFRIELGEVETALARCQGVRECVVVARDEGTLGKRLVAYVAGEALDVASVRSALKDALPEYMVPSAFVVLPALPLTPNGKVDRKALPSVEPVADARESYVAPRTPTEEVLAGEWAQVLGVARVGTRDGFFDLGGHSLLATQVISRIRSTLGVELPLRALFEAPTVAELAARIDEARRGTVGDGPPPLVAAQAEGATPLSFAQQRLWFIDQLEPGTATYNIPAAVRMEGPLDVPALEHALQFLLLRHEALRTRIRSDEGHPVQVILPAWALHLVPVDLGAVDAAERETEAQRLAGEEARRPFELSRGLLFRATLLRLTEQQHVLLLTVHHIVSDGWSMGVLVRELTALYEAFRTGQPASLPELPVRYTDYATWQRGWLQGDALEARLAWWMRQLGEGTQTLELATDRPRPAVQTFRGARLPLAVPAALSDALRALGRREGVTPFMTLLAAWQVLLSRYSGQDDIRVGTPIAGRDRTELEGLVGFFVNTLVLRAKLGGGLTFRELLKQVRETTLGAFAHQEVPFEKLVEALAPERDLRRPPLFQVMFALQQETLTEQQLPGGLSLFPMEADDRTAKYELTLSLTDTPKGFLGSIEYNTDLFDAATVERMAGHLEVLLRGIAANPDAKVGRLELLTAEERQRQVVAWNATRTAYPREQCVHTLVTAQVERTPDVVALDFAGEQRTYRQVETRANQLAHRLRKLGVGRGSR